MKNCAEEVRQADVQVCQQMWLTVRAAAKYLDVSPEYIRLLMAREGLSYYKVRHTVFIRKEDIDQLIESHQVV